MKILVTGANGQLGKTFRDGFKTNSDHLEFTFVSRLELDISNQQQLTEYFETHTFNYCINCAAYTNVEQAEESIDEAFRINDLAVGYLAECCRKNNIILIHISTDYVFDGKKTAPYLETDPTSPINQYGRSKLAGEKRIQQNLEHYFVIRTSWLYSKYPKNFVTTIVSKIIENSDLTITTSQQGTPTSCYELAKFIVALIITRNSDYGIYHFSSKGNTTWYGFALKIAESFADYNSEKISPVDTFKSKAARPNYSVMDNSKAQSIYSSQNVWTVDTEEVVKQLLKNTN